MALQDSLYTTKQEQLKMAAEAMQSAAAAMQGMAGMASSLRMQQQQGRGTGPGLGGGPLPPVGVAVPPHMQGAAHSSPFGAQAASPFPELCSGSLVTTHGMHCGIVMLPASLVRAHAKRAALPERGFLCSKWVTLVVAAISWHAVLARACKHPAECTQYP